MDAFDELKSMAKNASFEEPDDNDGPPDSAQGTIKMWQEYLGCTYDRAVELVGITKNAKRTPTVTQQTKLSPTQARTIYALKLGGPLSTPQTIQAAANIPTIPKVYHGRSENGVATFCKIDGQAKVAIENWLRGQKETEFEPLFVPEARAYKELCPESLYPTLGIDTTLPQYRPQQPCPSRPASYGHTNDEYPVWYFFYGTLASIPKLRSLLSIPEDEVPELRDASVRGGKMKTWGQGKYNALVDGLVTSRIKGSAYLVMSEEHEDALREYETDEYEVVRCAIEMHGDVVDGYPFVICHVSDGACERLHDQALEACYAEEGKQVVRDLEGMCGVTTLEDVVVQEELAECGGAGPGEEK
ncbi:hypothetical protein LSUE1_G006368, partial [Lachnellula suecica]